MNVQKPQVNGGQNNGTSQNNDNSVLINMITQMNKEFSARLSSIENCLTKLGIIENEVAMARADVANIKADNSSFNNRLLDVEIYCQNQSDSFDDLHKKADSCSNQIKNIKDENGYLRHQLAEMKSNYASLNDDFLELKTRSMQENLLFFDIPEPEQPRSTNDVRGRKGHEPENVETSLRNHITDELSLDPSSSVDDIKFDRVHRLGPFRSDRNSRSNPRPIIAKFERFTDREKIRKAGIELNSSRFSKFRIREQFPKEIEERRKMLYPAMYRLKANPNNRVSLVRDKLYVNGHLYIPEDDPEYRLPRPRDECHSPKRNYMPAAQFIVRPPSSPKRAQGATPKYNQDSRNRQQPKTLYQTPITTSNKFDPLYNADDRGTSDSRVPGQKHKNISPLSDQNSPKKQKDFNSADKAAFREVEPGTPIYLSIDNEQQVTHTNTDSTDSANIMDTQSIVING